MVIVNKILLSNLKHDELNNLALRSDIENELLGYSKDYQTSFSFEGYVGNRPINCKEEYHEDDTWAIDLQQDNLTVESYIYSSEFEYLEDIRILKQ